MENEDSKPSGINRIRSANEIQEELHKLESIKFLHCKDATNVYQSALGSEISTIVAVLNWIGFVEYRGEIAPAPSKHIQDYLDMPENFRFRGDKLIIPV